MVQPGRFKHFRGLEYRVLFAAVWVGPPPNPDDYLWIYVAETSTEDLEMRVCVDPDRSGKQLLMEARWSGNGSEVAHREPCAVYVLLSGVGRVSVRPVREFEMVLPGDLHVERFKRIGE